ncbi:hypothetical protein WA026_000994 [Henosepilachna vigintioctopunctata]|uniref:Oxysterol-binding protein n=1 Tax=Henosepilachna vigintioctopunctata TaxID=420089 RepID=A0AAW1V8Z8_9CUCU
MSTRGGSSVEQVRSSIGTLFQRRSSSSRRESTYSRRERIPDKPKNFTFSVWSILKNCVGKDLSQIALPVNFSEPLSTLQRLTEDFEYSALLDKAALTSCPYEQLAYLASFIISGYASSVRTTKPFNPLLGETYEFDRREDLGWRVISEKVSHRPPHVAQYCEGSKWTMWQEYNTESKFTGKDLMIEPQGEANITFKGGNSYTWNKVSTVVHNFLFGSLWIEQQGEIKVIGKHNTEGITCTIKFIPYSWRSRDDLRKFEGKVLDANGVTKWKLGGTWDKQVEITRAFTEGNAKDLPESQVVWKCFSPPAGSENFYGFSTFACQLNEPETGIAPTDSRLRPDQRLMENGLWNEANQEKIRLEEKQRQVMRMRVLNEQMAENEGHSVQPYRPIWFNVIRKENGRVEHIYKGNYWKCKEKQNWSVCPDIFS